jgi:hypothetical protein
LLVRELDERLRLTRLFSDNLTDNCRGKDTQLPLPDLLRQSIYGRVAGYEDLNDTERLSQDPNFRLIGSVKIRAGSNHGRSAGPHRWLVERFALRVVIQREIPGSWSSTFSGQHATSQTPGRTKSALDKTFALIDG